MPTSSRISWSDLPGRHVGLWGLGIEGRASLRRLEALGITPVLVDDDPPADVADRHPVLATGAGGLSALEQCDVVIKGPGISRHRPDVDSLVASGVAVVGGLGLWLEGVDRARVLVVTGTKGKSTTAAIAGRLIEGFGHRCRVAGNIGCVPYDPAVTDDVDYWVVEVSSFQATDLACAPPVVAVTSLHPDHLDWHGDVETYYAEKLSVCTRPGARLTVADGDDRVLLGHRHLLGPEIRWVVDDPQDDRQAWTSALRLPGAHNRKNALIARAAVAAMGVEGAEDDAAAVAAIASFDGLPSRLKTVGAVGDVSFVDDSLSTNVLPTVAALSAFTGRRVALITGGHDRGIDYRPLAEAVASRSAPTALFTLPSSGRRIGREVVTMTGGAVDVTDFDDLATATAAAVGWARPDGVVLLSPAAPSFGQFRDYRERARAFVAAARACGATTTPSDDSL